VGNLVTRVLLKTLSTLGLSLLLATLVCVGEEVPTPVPPDTCELVDTGRFADNGDGTLSRVDAKVDLLYAREAAPDSMSFEDAKAWCDKLDLAGRKWRLPTLDEVRWLVHDECTVKGCRMDQKFAGPCAYYWALDQAPPCGSDRGIADMGFGALGYDNATFSHAVRCVAPTCEAKTTGAFADNGDGTATWTSASGSVSLRIQKDAPDTLMTWDEGQSYCRGLSLAGKRWRMPVLDELERLRRTCSDGGCLLEAPFTGPCDCYWASDAEKDSQGQRNLCSRMRGARPMDAGATSIRDIADELVGFDDRDHRHHVRCVESTCEAATGGRFQDRGDGTVGSTDPAKTAVWARDPAEGIRSWEDAAAYCRDLALAGKHWRLPRASELADVAAPWCASGECRLEPPFAGPCDCYWTSDQEAPCGGLRTLVSMESGADPFSDLVDRGHAVRCVESSCDAAPAHAFEDRKDGTIALAGSDSLRFTAAPADVELPWKQAKAWCEGLDLAGAKWRLPTVAELETLVRPCALDLCRMDPAFGGPCGCYWTSDPKSKDDPADTARGFVNMESGSGFDPWEKTHAVRCATGTP
jgi:formylglycine-generating enzyme required for sulfatase activity